MRRALCRARRWVAKKVEVPHSLVDAAETTGPVYAYVGKHGKEKFRQAREQAGAAQRPGKTSVQRYEERAMREKLEKVDEPHDVLAAAARVTFPGDLSAIVKASTSFAYPMSSTAVLLKEQPRPMAAVPEIKVPDESTTFVRTSDIPGFARLMQRPHVPEECFLHTTYWDLLPGSGTPSTPRRLSTPLASRVLSEAGSAASLPAGNAPAQLAAGSGEDTGGSALASVLATTSGGKDEALAVQDEPGLPALQPGMERFELAHEHDYPKFWYGLSLGSIVPVKTEKSRPGWAVLQSAGSRGEIGATVICWGADKPDAAYWAKKVRTAYELRGTLVNMRESTAYRLANGVADGLPGVIVDVYGAVAVVVVADAPGACLREVLRFLKMNLRFAHILLADARSRTFLVKAAADNVAPAPSGLETEHPAYVALPAVHWHCGGVASATFTENGVKMLWTPDQVEGPFTGHYLQHSSSRQIVAALAEGKHVLDLFCGTGGFGLAALDAGASTVTFVDGCREMTSRVEQNLSLQMPETQWATVARLETVGLPLDFRYIKRRFDVVIVDPPDVTLESNELTPQHRAFYRSVFQLAVLRTRIDGFLVLLLNPKHHEHQWIVSDLRRICAAWGLNVTIVRSLTTPLDHPQRDVITAENGLVLRLVKQ